MSHARLRRDLDGRFVIENSTGATASGWGIHEQRLKKTSHFQLGEQRFRLRVPGHETVGSKRFQAAAAVVLSATGVFEGP